MENDLEKLQTSVDSVKKSAVRTTVLALACLALASLGATASYAAGPFDGTYRGESKAETGDCPYRYDINVTIRDGRITGKMITGFEQLTVNSVIDRTGKLDEVFAYNGRTVLKVSSGRLGKSGGKFSWLGHARFPNAEMVDHCRGTITLERNSASPQ